jgi:hypothetical protein
LKIGIVVEIPKKGLSMKLLEGIFHSNAVALSLVALLAYYTDAMLIAAILFSLAIITEAWVILFKDEYDYGDRMELLARKVRRKIQRVQRKIEKEKRDQYLCSKCKATTPVMS